MEKKFMSVKECAEYLGMTVQSIHIMTSKFQIPFYKPRRKLYFLKEEIDQWIMAGKREVKNG